MRPTTNIGLALAAATTLFWAAPVNAASIYSSCSSAVESEVEKFVCQVRSDSGQRMQDLGVEVDDSGPVKKFTAIPYSWVRNQSAFYFIVQTSSVNSEQLSRMYDFLSRMAYPGGKQKMGFATAGASFEEKAPLGSSRLRIDNSMRAVRSISPKTDGKSVILSSIETAIDKLESEEAERRAVVIISDADPSTDGVSESKIVDLAKKSHVALYFVTFGKNSNRPSGLLKSLARDTKGGTHDVSDLSGEKLLEFASELSNHLENGYIVSFNARGLPQSSTIKISANVDGDGRTSAEPITVDRQTEDSWLDSGQSFVKDNLYMLLAALGLGVGGILVLRSIGARKRRSQLDHVRVAPKAAVAVEDEAEDEYEDEDDEFAGEDRLLDMTSTGAHAKPKAWLELIGTGGDRVPLYSGNLQVGRSKDSDIRLTNSSVHRQHAMIQMDADGSFSIHDLGTANGIFVNGIRCNQRTLVDGDLIELGEVKLRFAGEPA